MKQCYTLGVAFIALTLGASAQIQQGLIGEFAMAGNVNNAAGAINNGQIIGNVIPTTDRFFSEGCAYEFPGTPDDYISIDYNEALDIAPEDAFSVSLWYQGGSEEKGDFETLLMKSDQTSPFTSDFYLALYDLNKPLFGVGEDYDQIWVNDDELYLDTSWHHLVATYDNSVAMFYLDGSLVDMIMDAPLVNTEAGLQIGQYCEGKLDDIRIYDRAISANDVGDLYMLEGNCASATGLKDNAIQQLLDVYPNPTNGELTIQHDLEGSLNISIYSIQGKKVYQSASTATGFLTVDVSALAPGFYSALITGDANEIRMAKFVVED